jgi:hypothetical protein
MPITQQTLTQNETEVKPKMVKVEEIPEEGERVDLSKLPKQAELKAVSEEWVDAAEGKTGGLVIHYQTRDGKTFPQKYSKVSGKVLKNALRKLGVTDTAELQKAWYLYELQNMRTGYPRMIPIKKAKQ